MIRKEALIMVEIKQIARKKIMHLIRQHRSILSFPRDDYWNNGFLPDCSYYSIEKRKEIIGYFGVDPENVLIDYYVDRIKTVEPDVIFDEVIACMHIHTLYVESYDNPYFVMAVQKALSTRVFFTLYEGINNPKITHVLPNIDIKIATEDDCAMLKDFYVKQKSDIDKEFLLWYVDNWVQNKGLYIFYQNNEICGVGELRLYPEEHATGFLGVLVSEEKRHEGIGSYILSQMRLIAREKGLLPVCSSENLNPAADKTIRRSGFTPVHRIFKMHV